MMNRFKAGRKISIAQQQQVQQMLLKVIYYSINIRRPLFELQYFVKKTAKLTFVVFFQTLFLLMTFTILTFFDPNPHVYHLFADL